MILYNRVFDSPTIFRELILIMFTIGSIAIICGNILGSYGLNGWATTGLGIGMIMTASFFIFITRPALQKDGSVPQRDRP